MQRMTYIAFVRDNKTQAEFIYTYAAEAGAHNRVIEAAKRKYPAPAFTVHTAYALEELEGIAASIRRWTATPAPQNPRLSAAPHLPARPLHLQK